MRITLQSKLWWSVHVTQSLLQRQLLLHLISSVSMLLAYNYALVLNN
jgi:hypothetical protein